ncbi:LysR family transcriptional regulator [Bacterioplanes sanyensis]|uniref:LysR family transcriptional regulator n=1 Tax=Bacterioplanes sanyensis TaxID=1249553 RepID=UPI0018EE9F8C|nr:LysR family transcriptional regulator [Bacterioplanes sanyensis]
MHKSVNWDGVGFDWNQVRAFVVAAEEGSLSAAARALQQTQPTLSRQVTALEQALGVTLFERGHRQLQLTSAGVELLQHARSMAEQANRMALAASGQSQAIEGRVCITATELLATYHLPKILSRLREQAPGIQVDVVASDQLRDLLRREADIAIRHAEPQQPEVIARRLGNLKGRIYADYSVIAAQGMPQSFDDLAGQLFIGVDDSAAMLEYLAQQGLSLKAEQFRIQTGSGNCMLQLIREGLGFGFLPHDIGELFDDLVAVLPQQFNPDIPIWLATHRELRTSQRIRLVYDLLASELTQLVA